MSFSQLKTFSSRILNIIRINGHSRKLLNRHQFIFTYFITKQIFQKTFPKFPILLGFSFGFSKKKVIEEDKKMTDEKTALEDLFRHNDQLFDQGLFYQEIIDSLKKYPDQNIPDIKWRLVRAMFNLAKITPEKSKSEKLMLEAYDIIKDALEQDDKNFQIHKWYAIMLDKRSELIGMKERLNQLENIKKHMVIAAELNPNDAVCEYLLGSFSYGLADLPWFQKKLVSTIFTMPINSSYEQALIHFLKAEEIKPNFYSLNLLMIGKCYLSLKDNVNAKIYLEKAFNFKECHYDDKKCKEEAGQLLEKLK